MGRIDVVERLVQLVGPDLEVIDARKGWPAIAELETSVGKVPLSMFVASVRLPGTGRNSDGYERRVQNPGQNRPIIVPPSTVPVILGLWTDDKYVAVLKPVVMAADAWKRQGLMTRHSVFARLEGLQNAMNAGWDTRTSDSGEQIAFFWPDRLREFVETTLIPAHVAASSKLATSKVSASAHADEARERRLTTQLVRDARFGSRVIDAYGARCSLCDLNLGLVQAAHIYPASAPGSCDELWNGLSLCANHHVAFDRHHIFIDPDHRTVLVHPWLRRTAQTNASCAHFVESTFALLKEPKNTAYRPQADMFRLRHQFFENSYDWADPSKAEPHS